MLANPGIGRIAFGRQAGVDAEAFLADVRRVAGQLPDRSYLINLCEDRYKFLVCFSAALIRNQVNLLPPNRTPRVLDRLAEAYPGTYRVYDHEVSLNEEDAPERWPGEDDPAAGKEGNPRIPEDRLAVIAFTSGSTGQPQPHPKTWHTLCESATLIGQALGLDPGSKPSLIATVPQQHMYGLETSILLALRYGGVLSPATPFFPADIASELRRMPIPRVLITTPVHLRALLEGGVELPVLDLLVSATAPLPASLAGEAERRYGARVLEIYGCTEAGSIACRRTALQRDWQLFPGLRLIDSGHGHRLEAAYLQGPVPLNDLIEIQGPGRFVLQGRLADQVNIAGKRTSLSALNHALNEIAGVRDGVFFLPGDPGERTVRLTALAVAPGLTAAQIVEALRAQIDPVFLPRPLYLVDSLPYTATGKLPRQRLEELIRERGAAE